MKRVIAVVLLTLMPLVAFAGPSKEVLADELMGLMQMDRMMAQMKHQVERMMEQMNAQFNVPDHAREEYDAFQKKIMEKAFEIMDIEGSKTELKALFVELYTLEELEGIVSFYKSPVGKSMLEKQPQVMQRAFEISQGKIKKMIPELQRMSAEFQEKMEAKEH